MTSVLRGGGGVSQFLTIGGGGCVISILKILTGGGGVKNPENYADVICTWPLRKGTRWPLKVISHFKGRVIAEDS